MSKTAENPYSSSGPLSIPVDRLAGLYKDDINREVGIAQSAANMALGTANHDTVPNTQPLSIREIVRFAEMVGKYPDEMLKINSALLQLSRARTIDERAKRREQILAAIKGGHIDMGIKDAVGTKIQKLTQGESDLENLGQLQILGEDRLFRDHYIPIIETVDDAARQVGTLISPAERTRKQNIKRFERAGTVFDQAAGAALKAEERATKERQENDHQIRAFEGQITDPQFVITPDLRKAVRGLISSARRESDALIQKAHAEAQARTAAGTILPSMGTVRVTTAAEQVLVELEGTLNLAYGLALANYLNSVYRALMLTSQQTHAYLRPFFEQLKAQEKTWLQQIQDGGQMLHSSGKNQH